MARTYLAGKYTAKPRLRDIRKALADVGVTVNSRWLDTDYPEDTTEDIKQEEARNDIQDVLGAQTLILDTLDESNTGGREFEFGLFTANRAGTTALALNHVYLIGPVRHVFHNLVPATNRFADWGEFFAKHVAI